MRRTANVFRRVVTPLVHRTVRRRLVSVEGIQHLPPAGPVILAPCHTSYFDHFLMSTVAGAVRDEHAWFLTKAEAFEKPVSRLWHTVMHCIPVDRNRPSADSLAAIGAVLADGGVLVVYPEGTRNTGAELLPLKRGAFWFAVKFGVPVIPVGIAGAREVLPKGGRRLRKRPVRLVFGAPLADDPSLPRAQRVRQLQSEAETRLPELVKAAGDPAGDPAMSLGVRVARQIDESFGADRRVPEADLRRLERVSQLVPRAEEHDFELAVQQLRIRGLRAQQTGGVRGFARVRPIRRIGLKLLRHNPGHPMANYIVARWYLTMPRMLGGGTGRAVEHFARAVSSAPATDTRYAMGLAEALIAADRAGEAQESLRTVIDNTTGSARGAERVNRARGMLSTISTGRSGHI